MGFAKNNVLWPKYIDIYNFGGGSRGNTWSTLHFLFIIKEKVQECNYFGGGRGGIHSPP